MNAARRKQVSVLLALVSAAATIALGLVLTAGPSRADEVAGDSERASQVAAGASLFLAKGCVRCHRHDGVTTKIPSTRFGPDLTTYSNDPAFLRAWLRDPAAVRSTTEMPNLQLDDEEIDALIAFINQQT